MEYLAQTNHFVKAHAGENYGPEVSESLLS